MNYIIASITTLTKPNIKLLEYFSKVDYSAILQNKTYDVNFCTN